MESCKESLQDSFSGHKYLRLFPHSKFMHRLIFRAFLTVSAFCHCERQVQGTNSQPQACGKAIWNRKPVQLQYKSKKRGALQQSDARCDVHSRYIDLETILETRCP